MKFLVPAIISILFFSPYPKAYAKDVCAQVKLVFNNGSKLNKALCYNKKVDTVFSPNCLKHKCALFEQFKNPEALISLEYESPLGSPTGFVCAKLGGNVIKPYLVNSSGKFKVELCQKGEAVVDLGSYFLLFNQAREAALRSAN